jgi:group I intron endonuclease
MIFYVYGLFDPRNDELRYVGYTQNYKNRLNQHCRPSKLKANSHKNNWIKSIKANNSIPKIQILETHNTKTDALNAEIDLIAYFKYIGCDLTNVTDGGDEGVIYTRTDEIRSKISKSSTGRKHTEETKCKISKTLTGIKRNHSEEHKKKISQTLTGRKLSEDTKKNIFKNKNFKITLADVEEMKKLYQSKQYTQKQLAQMFNVDSGYICRLINGKCGGRLS